MYDIQVFNGETGEWESIQKTDFAVRIVSERYVPKTLFETDDPECNG